MPELPEVETVKRTLNELVNGKQIENVTVRLARIIQRPDDIQAFAHLLAGHSIVKVERRGKFLRIVLDGLVLVSHLRMEGRYGLFSNDDPLDKHTHVIFHFTDGTELRYTDVRQFGTMHLFQMGEDLQLPPLNKLGQEPLEPSFTPERFKQIVSGKSTKIKSLLLNQEYIVGIGNIYVDESLHRAGIHPEDSAKSLTDNQLDKLHHAIVSTLAEAVNAGGSSVKSYVNGQGESGTYQQQLLIYGRKDQPCSNCGTMIEKTVVGGRGTHYCPNCQRPTVN
ncbi:MULTISPECIES: DNA-formamidopyrimidine glycosylase [Paenibacillus]|uniref:Formamidopyrimidine-DNA glycosylase n=1 Tax=Paenibacillus odorifer TaxID=189426 RepID=A0A1R0X363_9BACL|nr:MULTISPECIES: DNA-formamidopyrimidine glycosylase [Paenibacillus]ETT64876.1 formamidopyrimidine/5-formyluracil/ 5-hydroxymethyluracil DNA glycosylase [Paenibacillus sp. FSL H8-237]OMD02568.1 DNA-formamidopyrimidine glycosylase [Paenibacillus odorifer]OMD05623.1 DNA-formamidopyrimidine glycosylase [Paenibacillus odorifer]OMD16279.1 DNA-formamidopyrimidine glycosylase [Paenibacillus odorifer]OMD23930.1 DNA-formamidopyrimidine glycosylase [Paenibacillus odorifer]